MNYRVKIQTLSPIHIGTGQDLLTEYDLKLDDPTHNQTYRLNVDEVFDHALGVSDKLDQQIMRSKPAQLVELADLRADNSPLVQYRLKGLPQSTQVKEQIKSVWGKLYLPGSSLKGALRTIIGCHLAQTEEMKVDPNNRAKFADDDLDKKIFGRNPNYDLLRCLQVADSKEVSTQPHLFNVSVVKGETVQAPIDLEAIPPGVTFETTFHVEDYLFAEERKVVRQEQGAGTVQWVSPKDKLGWSDKQIAWLDKLPFRLADMGYTLAESRLQQEIAYFERANLPKLVNWSTQRLKQLQDIKGTNAFFMQLGWGGGWDSKTFGELLRVDKAEFMKIRTAFTLGKSPQHKGKWQANLNDTFPASRRLVVKQRQPLAPLGWVLVVVEKV